MSIEDLITKIILGSVTQKDFYAYSMNIDDLLRDLSYGESDKTFEAFGFYTARNYNQGWFGENEKIGNNPTSLVIGIKNPQRIVVRLTGGKLVTDKEYTVAISYPV